MNWSILLHVNNEGFPSRVYQDLNLTQRNKLIYQDWLYGLWNYDEKVEYNVEEIYGQYFQLTSNTTKRKFIL